MDVWLSLWLHTHTLLLGSTESEIQFCDSTQAKYILLMSWGKSLLKANGCLGIFILQNLKTHCFAHKHILHLFIINSKP